jgi:superfamily I DNA/RNA helicase
VEASVTSHLPQPIGRQKEVLCLPARGHTVVLGTAGSGKTTLAIHRAVFLANPATDHSGRTLLVTFNRALVAYLRALSGKLNLVDVRTYHTFARGYLNQRGRMESNSICETDLVKAFCDQAVKVVRATGVDSPTLDRPIEFLVDEFRWIAQNGIRTLDDYLRADRVGRAGARVARRDRSVVFSVYEQYRAIRTSRGKLYDWDDLPQSVVSEFESDPNARLYQHVVIDEGQDFSPVMIRSLAAAIPAHGSLTFFGDMAQQIYGNKISWRTAGLSVHNVWEFEENYRNTKQIAQLALAIARTPFFRDVADLVEPKSPAADGPLPALVAFEREDEEIRFVAEAAQRRAQTEKVAVLFRDRNLEKSLRPLLSIQAIRLHRDLNSWPAGAGLFYGTYHAAKGLEFDAVFIPFASSRHLPHPPDVATFDFEDAASRDVKLLYVAVTRARSNLVLTYTGDQTPLLPLDVGLLQRARR